MSIHRQLIELESKARGDAKGPGMFDPGRVRGSHIKQRDASRGMLPGGRKAVLKRLRAERNRVAGAAPIDAVMGGVIGHVVGGPIAGGVVAGANIHSSVRRLSRLNGAIRRLKGRKKR